MPGIYSAHDAIIGVQSALGGRRGGASFVGAYDAVPSIVAACGMRRLLTSYTGALVRLRRASDNAEIDFGSTANGDLDTAAIATWLTATSGYVTTWYDQTGGGHSITQSTAAAQPLYVVDAQNSRPGLRWDGVNDFLSGTMTGIAANPALTVLSVINRAGTATGAYFGIGSNTGNGESVGVGWNSVSGAFNMFEWGVAEKKYVSTATTGIIVGVRSTAPSLAVYLNGVAGAVSSGVPSALNITETFTVGKHTHTGLYHYGYITEMIICNAALSAGNRAAAEAAANAYWSIY